MADLTLGTTPLSLEIVLARDADFIASLTRDDDVDWPVGSRVFLQFNFRNAPTVEWESELVSATASWNEDKADVNAIITGRPSAVKLWFVDGDAEILWAQGGIKA